MAKLEQVQINCGFKSPNNSSAVAYGRQVRDQMYDDALVAVAAAEPDGYLAQLRAAEITLETAAASADKTKLGELWLTVEGLVEGTNLYRTREFVAAL